MLEKRIILLIAPIESIIQIEVKNEKEIILGKDTNIKDFLFNKNINTIYLKGDYNTTLKRKAIIKILKQYNQIKGIKINIEGIEYYKSLSSYNISSNELINYKSPKIKEGFNNLYKKVFINKKLIDKSIDKFAIFIDNVNILNIDTLFNDLRDVLYISSMFGYEQNSEHHIEHLDVHLKMIIKEILIDYKKGFFSLEEKRILLYITLFHDIGKLFTRITKAQKLEKEGYIQNNINKHIFKNEEGIVEDYNYNDYKFSGHGLISAYIYKEELENLLISKGILTKDISDNIYYIILEHINLHTINHSRPNLLSKGIYNFQYKYKCHNKNLGNKLEKIDSIGTKLLSNPSDEYENYINLGLLFSKYDNLGRIKRTNK